MIDDRRRGFLLLLVAVAVAAACKSTGAARSTEDEAADLKQLCEPPQGDDSTSILLRGFPGAAGSSILSERMTTSRWKKWLDDVDTKLSKRTSDPPGARQKADELDAAGKSAGHSACWAAAAVRQRAAVER